MIKRICLSIVFFLALLALSSSAAHATTYYIDWAGGSLEVAITRDAVKNSPPMDSLAVPSAETMPPFVLI